MTNVVFRLVRRNLSSFVEHQLRRGARTVKSTPRWCTGIRMQDLGKDQKVSFHNQHLRHQYIATRLGLLGSKVLDRVKGEFGIMFHTPSVELPRLAMCRNLLPVVRSWCGGVRFLGFSAPRLFNGWPRFPLRKCQPSWRRLVPPGPRQRPSGGGSGVVLKLPRSTPVITAATSYSMVS